MYYTLVDRKSQVFELNGNFLIFVKNINNTHFTDNQI